MYHSPVLSIAGTTAPWQMESSRYLNCRTPTFYWLLLNKLNKESLEISFRPSEKAISDYISMKKFFLRICVNIVAFYLSSLLVPSLVMSSALAILESSILLFFINLMLRPLVLLIIFPINLITLGLFTIITDTLLVMLALYPTTGFLVPLFEASLITALIISALRVLSEHHDAI